MLSSKLVRNATLKVYKGALHGMCTTLKDRSTPTCWHSWRLERSMKQR
jgi:hypothetical protein